MASQQQPQDDEMVEVGVSQRLRWVRFIRDYEVSVEDSGDLYWPALYYGSHKEATEYSYNEAFQEDLVSELLENYASQQDDADSELGPVCRLLGLDGGSYYRVPVEETGYVLNFYRNVVDKFVKPSKKDKVFDMSKPEEEELWECYQAAFQEAKEILNKASKKRKRFGRNSKLARRKMDDDAINHSGGGGGSDDNNGNDKPDAPTKVSFQVAPPAGAGLNQQNMAMNAEAQVSEAQVSQQETKGVEIESSQEVAVAETVKPAPQQVAVAKKAKTTKDAEPPITPPFNSRAMQRIPATEPWDDIWRDMRFTGWTRETEDGKQIYVKPGRTHQDGVEGVDYFTSKDAVQAYVQSKVPRWRPPAWVADDAPPPRPPPAQAANNNNNAAAANRRAMSSSATIVTAESSMPSPPAPRQRRSRGAAVQYNVKPSLVAYRVKEKLWWRKKPVPTLSQVKPMLLELGIRMGEGGCFELPEGVGRSKDLDLNTLGQQMDVDTLRKFLCTRGLPSVPNEKLLNPDALEVLHQWVSFAYVPTSELDLSILVPPSHGKVAAMLSKFSFEIVDDQYFLPLYKRSGASPDERKEGVHYYRGLDKLRDYIRSTASFTWTKDLLEETEDDIENYPKEKALLRLWAASSPSELPTYETNMDEIRHMEEIHPKDENDFGIESEEEEVEDEEEEEPVVAVDEDGEDASTEESSEEEASVEEASEEEASAAASSDESTETEESPSEAESSQESEATGEATSESDSSSVQSGEESVPSDASSLSEEETPKGKRKAVGKSGPSKRTKKEMLPWWQNKTLPSFSKVKPILRRLGLVQDADGVFLLPGKEKMESLKDPESLRKYLCSYGIPKYSKDDPRKPEPLSPEEQAPLRNWISFANFPASSSDFREAIAAALPDYQKHFEKASASHTTNCVYSLGFQSNIYGPGFFPPGIDSVGRARKSREIHVIKDLDEVRLYVRTSERLSIADESESDDGAGNDFSDVPTKLLALRLWAALDPRPLRTYPVKPGTGIPLPESAILKPKHSRGSKKASQQVVDAPLDLPDWFTETTQSRLLDVIDVLKAKAKKARRGFTPHMSVEALELACAVRTKMVEMVRSSLDSETPKTIESIATEMLEPGDLSKRELQYFVAGDETKMVRAVRLEEIKVILQRWLGKHDRKFRRVRSEPPTVEVIDVDDVKNEQSQAGNRSNKKETRNARTRRGRGQPGDPTASGRKKRGRSKRGRIEETPSPSEEDVSSEGEKKEDLFDFEEELTKGGRKNKEEKPAEPKQEKTTPSKETDRVGSRVAKDFDGTMFFGTVQSFNEGLGKVVYDDGDEEELEPKELDQAIRLFQEQEEREQTKVWSEVEVVPKGKGDKTAAPSSSKKDEGSDPVEEAEAAPVLEAMASMAERPEKVATSAALSEKATVSNGVKTSNAATGSNGEDAKEVDDDKQSSPDDQKGPVDGHSATEEPLAIKPALENVSKADNAVSMVNERSLKESPQVSTDGRKETMTTPSAREEQALTEEPVQASTLRKEEPQESSKKPEARSDELMGMKASNAQDKAGSVEVPVPAAVKEKRSKQVVAVEEKIEDEPSSSLDTFNIDFPSEATDPSSQKQQSGTDTIVEGDSSFEATATVVMSNVTVAEEQENTNIDSLNLEDLPHAQLSCPPSPSSVYNSSSRIVFEHDEDDDVAPQNPDSRRVTADFNFLPPLTQPEAEDY